MGLFECAACGLVYLDPMPEPAALDQLYSDAYDGASEGYFRKVPQKMRRARGRMRQIAALVPRGRFLDVGCNGGFMVEAARERGFEAHGVDLDPVSIAWAKDHYPGGEFFAGRIEDYQTGAPFDAVYCSEVIEHVHGANAFPRRDRRADAPGCCPLSHDARYQPLAATARYHALGRLLPTGPLPLLQSR